MIVTIFKFVVAIFFIGAGVMTVLRLDLGNHFEHVIGSLLSIVFLLGVGGYLIFSAMGNNQKQKPAFDAKKVASICLILFPFFLILTLVLVAGRSQEFGMLCDESSNNKVAVRYKHSRSSSEFSFREDGKWTVINKERVEKLGGYITETSVSLTSPAEEKLGEIQATLIFDFLLLEHTQIDKRWDGKWIEDERYRYNCKAKDLF